MNTVVPQRILITGISGSIGRCIGPALAARGHIVTGLDQHPHPDFPTHTGDITDAALVRSAMTGIDTLIHLAAYPNDADFFDVLLRPNVIGMMNVCHAAVDANVPRLILASSMQVISGHRKLGRPTTVADGPAPVNHYALTKVWLEETAAMIARTHPQTTVFTVRIGWFVRNVEEMQDMRQRRAGHVYLSHDDAGRFFAACCECAPVADGCGHILFAFSRSARPIADMTDTCRITGYQPLDEFPAGSPFGV